MNNNFNNMDDLFNQLMGNMNGYRTEDKRYLINGREVTPEEFAHYRRTGQLPQSVVDEAAGNKAGHVKKDSILEPESPPVEPAPRI